MISHCCCSFFWQGLLFFRHGGCLKRHEILHAFIAHHNNSMVVHAEVLGAADTDAAAAVLVKLIIM